MHQQKQRNIKTNRIGASASQEITEYKAWFLPLQVCSPTNDYEHYWSYTYMEYYHTWYKKINSQKE